MQDYAEEMRAQDRRAVDHMRLLAAPDWVQEIVVRRDQEISAHKATIRELRYQLNQARASMQTHIPLTGIVREIIQEVSEEHGVDEALLIGRGRTDKAAHARHELWWRLANEGLMPVMKIARLFKRDHSTVRWGINQHENRRNSEGSS